MMREAMVAAMVTVARALMEGECKRVGRELGDVVLPLPKWVYAKVEYAVSVELPELFSYVTGFSIRRVRRVTVELTTVEGDEGDVGLLKVYLEGEGEAATLDQRWLSSAVGIIMLWHFLRQRGIDFLEDIKRRLEREGEERLRAGERLEKLRALLEVALS
ncbi:MAG: hypothetical protein QXT28_08365 [Thermofilaceae archaeon]